MKNDLIGFRWESFALVRRCFTVLEG